jgi:hypothetical protein
MVVVSEPDGRALGWGMPAVAPNGECHQDRGKFAAGVCEGVFDATSVVAVTLTLHDTALNKRRKSISEQVSTDAKVLHQFIETAYTDEEVAHDQRRPPITYYFQSPGKGTVEVFEALLTHIPQHRPEPNNKLHY